MSDNVNIIRRTPIGERPDAERFAEQFSKLGTAIGSGIAGHFEAKKKAKLINEENMAILKEYGKDFRGITDPKMRESAFSELAKKQESKSELEANKKAFETVTDVFGPTFAKIWKEAPVGGKTELIKTGLEAKARGEDLEASLSPVRQEMEQQEQTPDVIGEYIFPKLSKEKGITPKELVSIQSQTRKDNMPIFIESQKRLRALAHENDSLNIIDSLNKSNKLPDKMKLTINSSTGVPYGILEVLGTVNPETQRFIKTINDFTTQAKDSYGSRVTNFDLQQFMKRLPTLMNTAEGRRQIVEQMRIVNDLNKTYEESLKTTMQHYGLDKIPYERAVEIAERNIADKENTLRQRFNQISDSLEQTQEASRFPVPEGTKITKEAAAKYYKMANGNKKEAMRMAKEDGYGE